MNDLQAIADRFESEAQRGEFTDALVMRDDDRLASLFTQDATARIPHIGVEAVTREAIQAGVERLQDLWHYFLQTTHKGIIRSRATPRSAVPTSLNPGMRRRAFRAELRRLPRQLPTHPGWLEVRVRAYEVRYIDDTPLTG